MPFTLRQAKVKHYLLFPKIFIVCSYSFVKNTKCKRSLWWERIYIRTSAVHKFVIGLLVKVKILFIHQNKPDFQH